MKTICSISPVVSLLILSFLSVCIAGCSKKTNTPEIPPAPVITKFFPVADTIGAIVTIQGANFSEIENENEIKFNGTAAVVLSASGDSLTAKVPAGASDGKISVKVKGRSAESPAAFTVLYAPSIISFTPVADTVGATVTIKGKNFGATIEKNIVNFPSSAGSTQAQIVSASDTQLVVKVPVGAVTYGRIEVKVNNYGTYAANPFYVLIPPIISSFSPFAGPEGSTVIISGKNFIQNAPVAFEVRFNGIKAVLSNVEQYSNGSGTIQVAVPSGATTGKISIMIGTITVYSASDFIVSSQKWTQKTSIAAARMGTISFGIGNKGYIGMGKDANNNVLKDLWEYDPGTDQWTRKADIPALNGKWSSSCFVINNKAYFTGGENGNGGGHSYETWEYDPANDQWTQKADYNGWALNEATAFSVGGKGYFGFGGYNAIWEYDPSVNTWSRKKDFTGQYRGGAMSFVIGNKAYVGCGRGNSTNLKDLWEYNPVSDSWTQKASLPGNGRYLGVAFSTTNYGYMGLGQTGTLGPFLKDIWEYNPATDSWIQKVDLPASGRVYAAAFSINGKGYAGTGVTTSMLFNDFWELTR